MQTLLSDRILWALVLLIFVLLGLVLFFAAVTLFLRIQNEREARVWGQLKDAWEPTLLEALSDPSRLPVLWESVREENQLQFLEFVLRYAQRLKSTERDVLRRAAAPYLPRILPQLKHRQMGKRARTVQTLGILGLPTFVEELKAAIYDPSPFVAAMAARLLAHEVGADVAPDLCSSLDRFHNFRTWYLVDMVVAMGQGAVPSIRETLANPAMPVRTRAVAAHSLSVLWDLESGDLAAGLLPEVENPEFLTSLLRLLAQVGTPEHLPAVRPHLESEEFFVRAAATRTLSELGGEDDLPLLIEQLGDGSSWVKMAAARGVYRIGGKATLSAFTRRDDPASPWFQQVLAEEGSR